MSPHNFGLSVSPSYAAFLQFSDECAIVGRALTKQTVGAAGIPACGIAARYSASYGCLQWCGQECPHLLRLAFSSRLI